MLVDNITFHKLSDNFSIAVNLTHRFSTDSIILSNFASPRAKDIVCDLCSGCGIIALSWFRGEHPPKEVYGVEIEKEASNLMQMSIEKNALQGRAFAINSDLNDLKNKLPISHFDVITCNPPYQPVGSGMVAETQRGVARHELDCTIQDICNVSAKLLKFGGKLCLCQRPSRLIDVMMAMRSANIEPKRLRMVQKKADTAPWLFLIEGKLGSRSHLVIETPLIMYNNDNSLSWQAKKLYQ